MARPPEPNHFFVLLVTSQSNSASVRCSTCAQHAEVTQLVLEKEQMAINSQRLEDENRQLQVKRQQLEQCLELEKGQREDIQAQATQAHGELQRLGRQYRNMEAECQLNLSKLRAYEDMVTISEDDVVVTDIRLGRGAYGG